MSHVPGRLWRRTVQDYCYFGLTCNCDYICVHYWYMAKTRTISIREFRQNLTKLLKEAQETGVHFVVMRHSVPVVHVTPLQNGDSLEELTEEVKEARKSYKEGNVYTAQEVLDMLEES